MQRLIKNAVVAWCRDARRLFWGGSIRRLAGLVRYKRPRQRLPAITTYEWTAILYFSCKNVKASLGLRASSGNAVRHVDSRFTLPSSFACSASCIRQRHIDRTRRRRCETSLVPLSTSDVSNVALAMCLGGETGDE